MIAIQQKGSTDRGPSRLLLVCPELVSLRAPSSVFNGSALSSKSADQSGGIAKRRTQEPRIVEKVAARNCRGRLTIAHWVPDATQTEVSRHANEKRP